ncbi:hypothetical protein B0H13DRAFT_1883885 [Mycena leptocephala]|nr:hypothetical protein B0H13DRAFT_1883885 [Mycena leptocephala]
MDNDCPDLVMRGLSDFPADEDLSALSVEALVEEVKRAVAGPRTWFPGSQSGPTIYREAKLGYATIENDGSRFARWLPGGRYILFQDSGQIQDTSITFLRCWEINAARSREVWVTMCVGTLEAATFDFRTGSKVIASLVLNDGDIHIVQARIQLDPPPGSPTIIWPWRMRISGDYMAWQGNEIIVLMNWLSGEFIAFESKELKATFELLHLYSMTSLGHLWRPATEFAFDNRSSLKGVPFVVLNVAGNNITDKNSPCTISVEVTGCPVHGEMYDLVVVVQNPVRPSSSSRLVSAWRRLRTRDTDTNDRPTICKKTISRYHFGLSSGTDPSPQISEPTLVSILRHSTNCPFTLDNPYWASPLSNSYAVCWNGHRRHRYGYPECHSGRVDVQRLHEVGTSSVVPLSVPDLDIAKSVKVSNTGAIMVRSDSGKVHARPETSRLSNTSLSEIDATIVYHPPNSRGPTSHLPTTKCAGPSCLVLGATRFGVSPAPRGIGGFKKTRLLRNPERKGLSPELNGGHLHSTDNGSENLVHNNDLRTASPLVALARIPHHKVPCIPECDICAFSAVRQ